MISPDIMGSPVRRLTNPITRCRNQPHHRYAGTDDGRGTDQTLDAKRLTLMSGRRVAARYPSAMQFLSDLVAAVLAGVLGGGLEQAPKLARGFEGLRFAMADSFSLLCEHAGD